jgi:xanthine dehydrogenase iron-sulfur cluster and FAD-binding subunit A
MNAGDSHFGTMSTATAQSRIEFVLNGREVTVDTTSSHTTLLDFLRARGLTGAKEGCAEGECGACTVVTVADDRGRATYRAVNSCLVLLPTIAGQEIYTVESLAASGTLAAAQQAMAAGGGSQCGYCTPGSHRPLRSACDGRQPVPMHGLSSDPRRSARARACAC